MMDLKCVDDIELESGDLATIDEPDASGQRIRHRLLTFRGEWFLDLGFGPPYIEQIFVKNPRLEIIGSVLRSEIGKSVSGSFTKFEASLNQATRRLTVATTVDTTFGQTSVTLTV